MKFNLLYFLSYVLITLLLVACSHDSLKKMGFKKKQPNQFTVSRQAPLEMPPDMFLRPPLSKSKKEMNNRELNDKKTSLDDILNDETINKDKASNISINKKSKQNRILKKILNKKATILK